MPSLSRSVLRQTSGDGRASVDGGGAGATAATCGQCACCRRRRWACDRRARVARRSRRARRCRTRSSQFATFDADQSHPIRRRELKAEEVEHLRFGDGPNDLALATIVNRTERIVTVGVDARPSLWLELRNAGAEQRLAHGTAGVIQHAHQRAHIVFSARTRGALDAPPTQQRITRIRQWRHLQQPRARGLQVSLGRAVVLRRGGCPAAALL